MDEKSNKNLSARRFIVVFLLCAIIFSGLFNSIRGDHLSDFGTILLGSGVALVVASIWVLFGLLLGNTSRAGKRE